MAETSRRRPCRLVPPPCACLVVLGVLAPGLLVLPGPGAAQDGAGGTAPRPSFRVKIEDDKPTVIESALPLDSTTKHIAIQHAGSMNIRLTVDKKTMHLGFIGTTLQIDGQVTQVGAVKSAPLPAQPGGRPRDGQMAVGVLRDVQITQTVEAVPTRPEV